MKQPDTSALRERLNNYTPGQELEQDKQEFEGLLLEVNCQIAELRNLLKEINAVKEELEKINQCSVSHIKAEEARRQRLEQRNDALANEFRSLKPEIADAHKNLENLITKLEAFSGTMINLHDLLKASFPIRFAETTDKHCWRKSMALPAMPYHGFTENAKKQTRKSTAMRTAYP